MSPIVRNILAIIVGVVVGSMVNLMLVSVGPSVIPLPAGADISDTEKLAESMKLMKPLNFLFPFLGHALGTLVGAILAAMIAGSRKMTFAMIMGAWFLLGGIAAVVMLGGPLWFKVADLVLAYLPMGYLGGIIGGKGTNISTVKPEFED